MGLLYCKTHDFNYAYAAGCPYCRSNNMPERDWEADEELVRRYWRVIPSPVQDIIFAALAERRLLAALLEWKPGPPKEYGLHMVRARFGGKIVTDSQYVCAGDFIKDILFHFGPLPEPPKEAKE